MTTYCAACGRRLNREPVILSFKGYGPVCAARLGYVPPHRDRRSSEPGAASARPNRRRGKRAELPGVQRDPLTADLFAEVRP